MAKKHAKTGEIIKLGLSYRFTIKEICEKTGCSNRTVSRILKENGWSDELKKICIRASLRVV